MAKWHEVRTDGSAINSAGFDVDSGSLSTDLRTSTGTSTSPIISSNSYSFISSDIGYWLYVRTGTNWFPGWYQITGISGTSAVVNAGIGSCVKVGTGSGFAVTMPFGPALYSGIGNSNSLSSGTWAIDYSQAATAKTSGTDLIVDAVINSSTTRVYSPTYIFQNSDLGNSIRIHAGTGWTIGIYYISGIAGTMASITLPGGMNIRPYAGNAAGVGTVGGSWVLGGATNHPNNTIQAFQDGGVWVKSGSYSSGLGYSDAQRTFLWGYSNYRGDAPKGDDRPEFTVTRPNQPIISGSGANIMCSFAYLRVSAIGLTNTNGFAFSNSRNQVMFCKASFCNIGYNPSNLGLYNEAYYCVTGFNGGSNYGSVAIGCTTGFNQNGLGSNSSFNIAIGCTTGFTTADTTVHNCVAHRCQFGFTTGNLGNSYVSCIASTCSIYGFNGAGLHNHRFISCADYLSPRYTSLGYVAWETPIALTQSPFVDPDNFDFELNDLPGGGALLKGVGGLGQLVGLPLSKAFDDVNVIQSKRQFFTPNMNGGIGG